MKTLCKNRWRDSSTGLLVSQCNSVHSTFAAYNNMKWQLLIVFVHNTMYVPGHDMIHNARDSAIISITASYLARAFKERVSNDSRQLLWI